MTTVTQAIAQRDQERPANGTPSASLAIQPGQDFWTGKQMAALAVLGLKNVSNADLAVFMHYCQKTQLDPFSRQIYGIMRREKQGDQWVDKFTIQVGIDGFRVIRDRIASRLGVSVEYEDSRWYDDSGIPYEVWVQPGPPAACSLAVLRDGKRFPAVVRYSAFAQMRNGKPTSMWERMDAEQLEKCAEAKALRRAFPHDLGGIYLEDEMPPQPATPRRVRAVVQAPGPAADIVHHAEGAPAPADPGPAAPDETPGSGPAAGPGPARPSKAATDKLTRLLQQIPLGDGANEVALIEWLTGHPIDTDLTKADVATVTSFLEDALKHAGGDRELAASRIWEQHRKAADAARGAVDGAPGHG